MNVAGGGMGRRTALPQARRTTQAMRHPMTDDHYVARTYLKHFARPSGMLRAYRKSDGATFPCRPGDICHEPEGDIIPDFLSEPGYLGEYRAEFEPLWNHAVSALKKRSVDMRDKLHIAGYWAHLMVCTPTWTRVAVEISNHNAINVVSAFSVLSSKMGRLDETLQAAVEDVERGDIKLETEADFVRAQSARSVLKFAWALYNAEWDVFENDTGTEYLTSDNPASFEDQGETWGPPGCIPFVRYLPVTPRLCITCDLTRNKEFWDMERDFTKEPLGTIRGGFVGPGIVEMVNACTAKCAEDLVLGSAESDYARDLTARYSKFRVETEAKRFREPTGFLIANRTRCIERKDRPTELRRGPLTT